MTHQTYFEKFKAKHALWKKCLDGDDRNSIIKQIQMMTWNAAVFNFINESRKISSSDAKGRKELNSMVNGFIDRCFVESQFLYIRRLTDLAPISGVRGVFSLVSLITDMKVKSFLITRQHLFAIHGMEYDYESVHQKELEYIAKKLEEGESSYWLPNELDSQSIQKRHEVIDALVGVQADRRSPNDAVRPEVFDLLLKKIRIVTKNISLYATKFIAHSASTFSREDSSADEIKITFDHLRDAHKVLCQIARFLDLYLISESDHTFLPMPQFNHLKFIDKPFVRTEDIGLMAERWNDFHKETDQWFWGLNELQQEMSTGSSIKKEV